MTRQKARLRQGLALALFAALALSATYAFIRLLGSTEHTSAQRDYTLMTVQCIMGIVIMMLPTFAARKWFIPFTDLVYIMYYLFLFCAVFLGEVLYFYYRVKHWDTLLHFFSGAVLTALGFFIIGTIAKRHSEGIASSTLLIVIFSFLFAMGGEAFWEMYEYAIDSLANLNMQKYMTEAGELLTGREALADTMKDICAAALGAFIAALIGHHSLKKKLRAPS